MSKSNKIARAKLLQQIKIGNRKVLNQLYQTYRDEFINWTRDKDIEILIEDNQYDILIEEEINAGQTEIILNLPISEFKAGRYYWKIIADDELIAIRTFFVRKDLIEGLEGGF